jgi:hypothetical protein
VALAGVFGVASLAAALRWPHTWCARRCADRTVRRAAGRARHRVRGRLHERAPRSRNTSVATSIERDPRIVCGSASATRSRRARGPATASAARVLADQLSRELGDPLLAHAHNTFASHGYRRA